MGEKVCAVIVTYNRKALLRECLQAVLSQTRPPDHVLVVDNASTDGTGEMLREEFPGVEVLRLPENQGGAGGFHEGMKRAYEEGFEWIWVMDDDTIPESTSLESLLARAHCLRKENRVVSAIGSEVVWVNGRLHPMNNPLRIPFSYKKRCSVYKVPWLSFVSVIISRSAVQQMGLPRKAFFIWNDDLEYFLRLGHCYLTTMSRATHKTKAIYTPADSTDGRYYYQVRNRIWILRSPKVPLFWRVFVILHMIPESLLYLARRKLEGLKDISRGLRDGFTSRPVQ